MFERFTQEARTTVVHAQAHARRLGHRYIGCEHLLLAMAHSGEPAGDVLRGSGVTPQFVEQEIVRLAGLGAGAGLFADLDRDALASIGIDLDAVQARIEASFGSGALARAAQRQRRRRRPGRLTGWRRRRRARRLVPAQAQASAPGGLYRAEDQPSGHIPFTPGAKKTLQNALREAAARHDTSIGAEHIVLGLLSVASGLVPGILEAAGTSAPALRAAITDRYRQAS